MNHKQRSAPFTSIGASSLLVVFLVLCLVTFAVLSLASARSDDAFSEKLAGRKTAYYTAVNQAEAILARVDETLDHTQNNTDAAIQAVLALNEAGLPELEGISLTAGTDDLSPCISFRVPIDDRQYLHVTLELSGNFYEIRSWQTITDTDWESDDTIQLLPID